MPRRLWRPTARRPDLDPPVAWAFILGACV